MPLTDGYGVLIGTINSYYRDPPDDFGKYYHGNIMVDAPSGQYHCAIDVDSKKSNIGVEWRLVTLRADELLHLTTLGPGYHALAPSAASGAVDYVRSPMFAARIGCAALFWKIILGKEFDIATAWKKGTDVQALADLEPLVMATQAGGHRVMIFGEPFTSGLGLHNIHQNQGDPAGSQWWAENGIWQDGCTLLQQSPSEYVAFLNKFTSQSYKTDNAGHPV